MHVAFVDIEGATGTIAPDWTIEYDGEFTETTDAVVSNMIRTGTRVGRISNGLC